MRRLSKTVKQKACININISYLWITISFVCWLLIAFAHIRSPIWVIICRRSQEISAALWPPSWRVCNRRQRMGLFHRLPGDCGGAFMAKPPAHTLDRLMNWSSVKGRSNCTFVQAALWQSSYNVCNRHRRIGLLNLLAVVFWGNSRATKTAHISDRLLKQSPVKYRRQVMCSLDVVGGDVDLRWIVEKNMCL